MAIKKRNRRSNQNIRISKPKSRADIQKISNIKSRIRKGRLNPKTLPGIVKSRLNGKVKDPILMVTDGTQSIFWTDDGGRNMMVKRNNDSSNLEKDIELVMETMMNDKNSGLPTGFPDKLIIELGPNDTRRAIEQRIAMIDPEMLNRLELVGGGSRGQVFTTMRSQLESASQDRFKNKAYKKILSLLEQGVALENAPDTLDTVDQKINVIDQIDANLKAARSSDSVKKSERNQALDQLKNNIDIQRTDLLNDFTKKISTVQRTPMEVMVHLLNSVKNMPTVNDNPLINQIVKGTLEQRIRQHDLSLDATHQYLNTLNNFLEASNAGELSRITKTLIKQLPDPSKGENLEPTRLQDNVYGRIFDSAIVNRLVDNPPTEVMKTMKDSARAMRQIIDSADQVDIAKWENIAAQFAWVLNNYDKRFWFPKTPALNRVAQATTNQEALSALKDYLNNPGDNGQALISVPYALVKLSILAQQEVPDKHLTPWMVEANKNYSKVITQVVGRTALIDSPDPRVNFQKVDHQPTEGSGITLRHQANPFVDPALDPSMRPTLANMPRLNKFNKDGTRRDFPSDVVQKALEQGAPFGSGVSGSTNIMVHLLSTLQANVPGIDTKNFLLGTMMFLTYDGGHSLHEALWTANQTDAALGLGLNIGDSTKPNDFVADYDKFQNLFGSSQTGVMLKNAMDGALDDTTNHFAQHSVFNKSRTNQIYASFADI